MTTEDRGRVRVPSWRGVFRAPWRIAEFWGFDFTRLVAGGPTAKAVGACWAAFIVMLLLQVAGVTFGLAILVRLIGVPGAVAWIASQELPDGRGMLSHALVGLRGLVRTLLSDQDRTLRMPEMTPVSWDSSCPAVQPGQVAGPASVTFMTPIRVAWRGNQRTIRPHPAGTMGTLEVLAHEQLRMRAR